MNASPRLLVCALVCVIASAGGAQNIEQTQKGVVRIVATAADGTRRIGTGFVVRATRDTAQIVTASHVVEGATQIEAQFFTQRTTPVAVRVIELEGGDPQGLAALSVTSAVPSDISVFRMNRSARINAGDPVTIVGFPQAGGPWAVTKGEIVGRRAKAIVFTGGVDEGSSGAPLIREGEVIGVVTERRGQFAYAVPADIAQSVLESWGVRFRTELRSTAATLTSGSVIQMIRDRGFHHPGDKRSDGLSASVAGNFQHEYEAATYRGDAVIIDHATGLMWQQSGSKGNMYLPTALKYAAELNGEELAGFADWRLPTIEELAALIEPIGTDRGAFIDRAFSLAQSTTYWSGDSLPGRGRQWGVSFVDGSVVILEGFGNAIVVRSLTGEEEAVAKGARIPRRPLPASLAESRIALMTTSSGRGWRASVMNADGSGARTIFQSPQDIYDAAWSPGGTRFAFVHGESVGRQVTVVTADGASQKNIIDSDRRAPTLGRELSWSPDERRIAMPCVLDDILRICLIDVDSGKAPSPLHFVRLSDLSVSLSWSPDGTRLAYALDSVGEIRIIDLRQMSVVSSGRSGKQPAWSPDGKRISFVGSTDSNYDIFVMDMDGSNLNRLTNHPAADESPSWSPDGTKIAFVSERVSGWAIYVMDADGGNPMRITDPVEGQARPVWLSSVR